MWFGFIRMRFLKKRRTRLMVTFSAFIILAYFDPLKRDTDDKKSTPTTMTTMTTMTTVENTKSAKIPLATKNQDTNDISDSSKAIASSQYIFPIGTYPNRKYILR